MDIYRKLCITKQLGLIIADENVPRAVSKYKYIWEFLPSRMKRIGVFITSRDEGRWKSHGSRVDNRGYRFLYTIHRFFDIHLPKLYYVHRYGSRKYFHPVVFYKFSRNNNLRNIHNIYYRILVPKIWNHFFFSTVYTRNYIYINFNT